MSKATSVFKKTEYIGKPHRIWEIDFIRGLCVLIMMFDHLMFDVVNFGHLFRGVEGVLGDIYTFAADFFHGEFRLCARIVIVALFFLTCGMSCNFSKSNLKRSGRLALVAILVSLATITGNRVFGLGKNIEIYFGVLHCMALSILIYYLLERFKAHKYIILAIAVVTLVGGGIIYDTRFRADNDLFMIFGFATQVFWGSGDYFPLLPWTGFLLLGGLLAKTLYPERQTLLPMFNDKILQPVNFVGRNALLFYIGHQVFFMALFIIISVSLGYKILYF